MMLKQFILVAFLFLLPLAFTATSECCPNIDDYLAPKMLSIINEQTKSFEVSVFVENFSNVDEPTIAAKNTPIFIYVYSDNLEKTKIDFQKGYTDDSGLIVFNYASYQEYADKVIDDPISGEKVQYAVNIKFLYCPLECACSECFSGLGVPLDTIIPAGEDQVKYLNETMSSLSEKPLSPQSPFYLLPTYTTEKLLPTPPKKELVPPFCLPIALIFALLGGAMYITGRNPFSGFDFTTPRMKSHFKYSPTGRGQYISLTSVVMAGFTAKSEKKAAAQQAKVKQLEKAVASGDKAKVAEIGKSLKLSDKQINSLLSGMDKAGLGGKSAPTPNMSGAKAGGDAKSVTGATSTSPSLAARGLMSGIGLMPAGGRTFKSMGKAFSDGASGLKGAWGKGFGFGGTNAAGQPHIKPGAGFWKNLGMQFVGLIKTALMLSNLSPMFNSPIFGGTSLIDKLSQLERGLPWTVAHGVQEGKKLVLNNGEFGEYTVKDKDGKEITVTVHGKDLVDAPKDSEGLIKDKEGNVLKGSLVVRDSEGNDITATLSQGQLKDIAKQVCADLNGMGPIKVETNGVKLVLSLQGGDYTLDFSAAGQPIVTSTQTGEAVDLSKATPEIKEELTEALKEKSVKLDGGIVVAYSLDGLQITNAKGEAVALPQGEKLFETLNGLSDQAARLEITKEQDKQYTYNTVVEMLKEKEKDSYEYDRGVYMGVAKASDGSVKFFGVTEEGAVYYNNSLTEEEKMQFTKEAVKIFESGVRGYNTERERVMSEDVLDVVEKHSSKDFLGIETSSGKLDEKWNTADLLLNLGEAKGKLETEKDPQERQKLTQEIANNEALLTLMGKGEGNYQLKFLAMASIAQEEQAKIDSGAIKEADATFKAEERKEVLETNNRLKSLDSAITYMAPVVGDTTRGIDPRVNVESLSEGERAQLVQYGLAVFGLTALTQVKDDFVTSSSEIRTMLGKADKAVEENAIGFQYLAYVGPTPGTEVQANTDPEKQRVEIEKQKAFLEGYDGISGKYSTAQTVYFSDERTALREAYEKAEQKVVIAQINNEDLSGVQKEARVAENNLKSFDSNHGISDSMGAYGVAQKAYVGLAPTMLEAERGEVFFGALQRICQNPTYTEEEMAAQLGKLETYFNEYKSDDTGPGLQKKILTAVQNYNLEYDEHMQSVSSELAKNISPAKIESPILERIPEGKETNYRSEVEEGFESRRSNIAYASGEEEVRSVFGHEREKREYADSVRDQNYALGNPLKLEEPPELKNPALDNSRLVGEQPKLEEYQNREIESIHTHLTDNYSRPIPVNEAKTAFLMEGLVGKDSIATEQYKNLDDREKDELRRVANENGFLVLLKEMNTIDDVRRSEEEKPRRQRRRSIDTGED